MELKIVDVELVQEADKPLLLGAIERSKRFENASGATLFVNPRRSEGWLEYTLVLDLPSAPVSPPRQFTIGCIQRTVGAELEFHS